MNRNRRGRGGGGQNCSVPFPKLGVDGTGKGSKPGGQDHGLVQDKPFLRISL